MRLIWLLGLWGSAAAAGETVKVPQQVSTLQEAVELVGEGGTIQVAPDWRPTEGVVYIDHDLAIESQSADQHASLPALVVHGADLDLARVSVVGSDAGIDVLDGSLPEDIAACVGFTSPWEDLRADRAEPAPDRSRDESGDGTIPPPPGICLVSASLVADELELEPVGNYGLQAIASEVSVEDLDASGFLVAPAVHVSAGSDLVLTRASFLEDQAGGVRAYGSTVTLSEAVFDQNASVFPTDGGDYIDGGADLWARHSEVLVEHSEFSGWDSSWSPYYWGGAIAVYGSDLEVRSSSFEGYQASYGAAVYADGSTGGGGTVSLEDVVAEGNLAGWGGAAYFRHVDQVEIDHCTFSHNVATSDGGAVESVGSTDVSVHRSLFCDDVSWGDGAAILVESQGGASLTLTNDVFLANRAWSGGTVADVDYGTGTNVGPVSAVNNTFLADLSSTGALDLSGGSVEVVNDIFHQAKVGLSLGSGVHQVVGGYNLWFENTYDTGGTAGTWFPGQHAVTGQDPAYQGDDAWDCDSVLYLEVDSPARDAGDPSILDADGTRSDIGAWGGPDADIPDHDGDEWGEDIDCDEEDRAVNPGADERCNLEDDDCDGTIDEASAVDASSWYADVDGDGFGDPATEVISCDVPDDHVSDGTDCDDSDGSAYPGADEVWNDEIDQDCDGFDEASWVNGGGTCSAVGGGATWWGWVGVGLVIRRRR